MLRCSLAVLILLCLTQPAIPRSASWVTRYAVCLKRAASGETASGLIARPAGFDCTTEQRRFGSGDYWALSQPLALGGRDRRASASPACGRRSPRSMSSTPMARIVRLDGDGTHQRAVCSSARSSNSGCPRAACRSCGCCGASRAPRTCAACCWPPALAAGAERGIQYRAGGDLCRVRRAVPRAADLQSRAVGRAAAPLPARLLRDGRCAAGLCLLVFGRARLGICPDIANNDRLRINYCRCSAVGAPRR